MSNVSEIHELTAASPRLQNPNEHLTAPEDAMQNVSVPVLPPSGGNEIIVRSMDVFSRYIFAYSRSNQDAKTTAKVTINIMIKHAFLPTKHILEQKAQLLCPT